MKISSLWNPISKTTQTNVSSELTSPPKPKDVNVGETLLKDYKSKEVKTIFDKYNVDFDAEAQKNVSAFMKGASGSEKQKLETVEIALYKGIEPTVENLETMHTALTRDADAVSQLSEVPAAEQKDVDVYSAKKIVKALKLPEVLKKAISDELDKGVPLKDALRNVYAALTGETATVKELNTVKQLLGAIKQALKQGHVSFDAVEGFKTESVKMTPHQSGEALTLSDLLQSDVIATTDEVESLLISSEAPENDRKSGVGVGVGETAIEKTAIDKSATDSMAVDKTSIAKTVMGRTVLGEAVSGEAIRAGSIYGETLTTDSLVSETHGTSDVEPVSNEAVEDLAWLKTVEEAMEVVLANMDEAFSGLSDLISIRTYLVETTTEATLQAKATFEHFRKETTQLLDQAQTVKHPVLVAENIGKAIDKISHLILKSEVTLYTDMFTEKKLLLMSSDLEKAQTMLKNGDLAKAQAIVKSALDILRDIKFQPSERKMQAFATDKMERLTETKSQNLEQTIVKHIEKTTDVKSARDILETLRFLGLNHEMEVAEHLDQKDGETTKMWQQENIKEILLKLMKEESTQKVVESAEQSLMNFTGQQMMNDSGKQDQPFYYFNLPVMDGGDLGEMKVYMKGAQRNHQIDWQNTEMYFGVQLKSTGPVGIKVKIQQQKVDVQILGDQPEALAETIKPVMERLAEIGYIKGDLTTKNYSEDKGISFKPNLTLPQNQTIDGKGFDFKI